MQAIILLSSGGHAASTQSSRPRLASDRAELDAGFVPDHGDLWEMGVTPTSIRA
jgi:hypothetical protein